MAHHKRKKPKNARSGCLMCKPWKMNGAGSDGKRLDEIIVEDIQEQQIEDYFKLSLNSSTDLEQSVSTR